MKQQNFSRNCAGVILLNLFLFFTSLNAQVTIGHGSAPGRGAILEIKTQSASSPISVTDNANITSTQGGLGLPRVKLLSKNSLQPFITSATAEENITHAGLTVYNINNTNGFGLGVYVWNGSEWEGMSSAVPNDKIWFYMPSFNLSLSGTTTTTFDLYSEYKKQFTQAGNAQYIASGSTSIPVYNSNELEYIVTYYDNTVVTINSITASGIMTYTPTGTAPTAYSLINIVFVVK
ncbi:hypothetical protein [Apibacter sp. HY039]|uniref:hypothetical protein n=1 Tax=Apibacter sp. HY039 TaxID=2501476 RepID=UPI000FEBFA3B|nr:hypothetical protein [Apibacter sp. HY039]